MRKKIFILGVGAQKAGTTWLHSQLDLNENIDMGFTKEYHVFDITHPSQTKKQKNRRIRKLFDYSKAATLKKDGVGEEESGGNLSTSIRRLSFIVDPSTYFDYFDYLHCCNPNIEAVGDITPSYSTLDRNAFKFIKEGLEAKGFTVKVVFLMRDPVERLWSQLRMERRNHTKKGKTFKITEESQLKRRYAVKQSAMRTRYDRTIIEVESVFKKEDVYYGFYETMFTSHSYQELSSKLGINLVMPDFDKKLNTSPKNEQMSYELSQEIAAHYSETYKFLENKFGSSVVDIWGSFPEKLKN